MIRLLNTVKVLHVALYVWDAAVCNLIGLSAVNSTVETRPKPPLASVRRPPRFELKMPRAGDTFEAQTLCCARRQAASAIGQ